MNASSRGVEERAVEIDRLAVTAVRRIPDHRMADRGEMHPDLMGAPGLERAREQAAARLVEDALHFVAGAGGPARVAHGHARPSRRRPPDGCVDRAARRRRSPPYERGVAPVDGTRGELLDQRVVGTRGACHDHEPARVAVEAVHDARPEWVADIRDLGIAREQPVHERSGGVAGARMHDQTRGLGDDDDVVVLVPHHHFDIGFGNRRHVGYRFAAHLDDLAFVQTPALADRAPVDEDTAVREERLHVAAAPTGEQRHRAVHPLAVERGRHLDRLVLGHFAGARNVPHTRMIAPIVMHESATLKTGNRPTAMKSTT